MDSVIQSSKNQGLAILSDDCWPNAVWQVKAKYFLMSFIIINSTHLASEAMPSVSGGGWGTCLFECTPKGYFELKIHVAVVFCPEHSNWDQYSLFTPLSQPWKEHPQTFCMGSPPPTVLVISPVSNTPTWRTRRSLCQLVSSFRRGKPHENYNTPVDIVVELS